MRTTTTAPRFRVSGQIDDAGNPAEFALWLVRHTDEGPRVMGVEDEPETFACRSIIQHPACVTWVLDGHHARRDVDWLPLAPCGDPADALDAALDAHARAHLVAVAHLERDAVRLAVYVPETDCVRFWSLPWFAVYSADD